MKDKVAGAIVLLVLISVFGIGSYYLVSSASISDWITLIVVIGAAFIFMWLHAQHWEEQKKIKEDVEWRKNNVRSPRDFIQDDIDQEYEDSIRAKKALDELSERGMSNDDGGNL